MSLLGSVDIRLLTAYLFGLIYFGNTPFANFDDKIIFDKLHWVGKAVTGNLLRRLVRYVINIHPALCKLSGKSYTREALFKFQTFVTCSLCLWMLIAINLGSSFAFRP